MQHGESEDAFVDDTHVDEVVLYNPHNDETAKQMLDREVPYREALFWEAYTGCDYSVAPSGPELMVRLDDNRQLVFRYREDVSISLFEGAVDRLANIGYRTKD